VKEFLRNIDQEDYHGVVYPSILSGDTVGQIMLDGDVLLVANPERYVVKPFEGKPEFPESNPYQGRFILQTPWDNKMGGK